MPKLELPHFKQTKEILCFLCVWGLGYNLTGALFYSLPYEIILYYLCKDIATEMLFCDGTERKYIHETISPFHGFFSGISK